MAFMIRMALLFVVFALVTPSASRAQTWRAGLTAAAEASLYVDYCQIRYGLSHDSPTWVFGYRLTSTTVTFVNGIEALGNVAAPRKWRPWVNALTLGFHLVAIRQTARRPIGLLRSPNGEEVMRIGIRLLP
jgi:hypothetical protein